MVLNCPNSSLLPPLFGFNSQIQCLHFQPWLQGVGVVYLHPCLVFQSRSAFGEELPLGGLCMEGLVSPEGSLSPSSEYSRLLSLRIDWFDPLVVQGSLKSLLQHHSSKASVLWRSAFFMVQLLHLYMTTGKTIGLTIWATGYSPGGCFHERCEVLFFHVANSL